MRQVWKEGEEEGSEKEEEEEVTPGLISDTRKLLTMAPKKSKKAGKAAKKRGYYRGKDVRAEKSR